MKRELRIERNFPAPRSLLFGLCVHDDSLEKWCGLPGFASRVNWLRRHPGETFSILMKTPDERYFSLRGEYRVIDPSQRLSFRITASDSERLPLLEADTDITFAETTGTTTLLLHIDAVALNSLADAILTDLETGCGQCLGRLADHVATLYAERDFYRDLTISSVLDAPRERVWQAWTTPKETDQWWGPYGFENSTEMMDLRPGGQWKLVMSAPTGLGLDACMTYQVIDPPNRLVYQHGDPADDDINNFEVAVTFEDVDGATRLTLRGLFAHPAVMFTAIRDDGAEGVQRQLIDRLAEFLKKNYLAQR